MSLVATADTGSYFSGWSGACSGSDPCTVSAPAAVTATFSRQFSFAGFFPPVDDPPTLNKVKAGSSIPVKFSLGGNRGLGIMASGYPSSVVSACDSFASADAIEETVTAGSSGLAYDATTDQYIYVWKTEKSWAGTCRQLIVGLVDGTEHRASFDFAK